MINIQLRRFSELDKLYSPSVYKRKEFDVDSRTSGFNAYNFYSTFASYLGQTAPILIHFDYMKKRDQDIL